MLTGDLMAGSPGATRAVGQAGGDALGYPEGQSKRRKAGPRLGLNQGEDAQKDSGWLLGNGLKGVVFASLGCRACGGVA